MLNVVLDTNILISSFFWKYGNPHKILESERITSCRALEGKEVFVPSLQLQVCFKLLGELDSVLSERALRQLETLFSCYAECDWKFIEKEMEFIYSRCLPEDLDTKALARDTVLAIQKYRGSERDGVHALCAEVHHTINVSLRKAFALLQP